MTGTTSCVYDEDEDEAPPLPVPADASLSGVLVQNTYCEYPAVANGAQHDGFAVMVHLKAPELVTAAPLDLVAVLDVSESMAGAKLAQVKRAMAFVIDRLGTRDRLGIVAFAGDARPVIPLTHMTDDGKAAAKHAVEALEASSTPASTNVRAGLDVAAKVLDGRRCPRNDVTSVILVSDGHESCVVPEFFLRHSDWTMPSTPVHTFGLGSDLDATAMYNISEATAGTFSFVEDHAVIQDALAQCVAGLRSVAAQDVYLEINICPQPYYDELNVTAVKSGRYKTSIVSRGEKTDVHVGELYADEERRILLFLDIPSFDDDEYTSISLINVHCSYMDVASRKEVLLQDSDAYEEIERPVEATDVARCVEVERELLRVAAAEDMALAREAAERGAYAEAARILDARRESLSRSAPALSGDDAMCAAVAAELHELSRRVADEREYRRTGRACILASMSSHSLQRGSSTVRYGCGGGVGSTSVFATPAMRKMEKLSEMMRKRQETLPPRPPLLENGSRTGVPLGSRRLEARLASAVPRLSMMSKYRRLLLKR